MSWIEQEPPVTESVTLKRTRDLTRVVYLTAIAHPLSIRREQSVTQTAFEIAALWQKYCRQLGCDAVPEWLQLPLPSGVLSHLTIQALPSGLVRIELGDQAIAAWLDQIILDQLISEPAPTSSVLCHLAQSPTNFYRKIFVAQHTHARCCSLLRLANRERRISLDRPDAHPNAWSFVEPARIPWLDDAHLRLQHPCEKQLICELLAGAQTRIHQKTSPPEMTVLQIVEKISRAFQAFHSAWQPLGSTQATTTQQMQAQLGLLMATQRVLHALLETTLNLDAPCEL